MAQNNYRGKNCDLDALFKECQDWFAQHKYQTQGDVNNGTWLLQARQTETWRQVVGASRAFNVLIQGEPNDFSVTLTTGEWATNLAAGGAAAVLTGGATLLISGVTIGWSKKIEGDISAFIEQRILFGAKAKSSHEQAIAQSQQVRSEKLQQLKDALDNGFITESAYNSKKQELEGQLHSAVEASATQGQLAKLKELFDAGILSQEEYEAKKREVVQDSDSERDTLLSNLRAALDSGILTQEEYETKKAEIEKQPAQFAKMKQLESARDAGVLSNEEFEIKKNVLLAQQ